jgi:hypothetical protein
MKMLTIKNIYRALVLTTCGIMITAFSPVYSASNDDFEKQVEDYMQKFPYQETFEYALQLTGGDPGKLNQWGQASRELLKAGEDSIVRVNNDTLYKTAFIYLGDGPVVLRSDAPSQERFSYRMTGTRITETSSIRLAAIRSTMARNPGTLQVRPLKCRHSCPRSSRGLK